MPSLHQEKQPTPEEPNRPGLPPSIVETQPSINVGGVDVPIPEPGPLVAAGSLAVTTAVTSSTIAFTQLKNAAEPMIKNALRMLVKRKKLKSNRSNLSYIIL